ncbi:MAG TPA: FAD-dependent oxidoreductase [Rhizomicrobium sp.]|nr:FAD-dependent oxidoreductase [Rhizomicrobium sp.]
MAKVAIIGTGIAGLTAAYHLGRHHDIAVYEKDAQVGGHSRTRVVDYGGRQIPVDTGFIVYNERNYPNLTALFRALGVAVEKSNMSFALTVRDGWLEWGAESAGAIFAQRRNLLRPRFLNLFGQVLRFNSTAEEVVARNPHISLGELLETMGLGDWFRWYYLLPMAGAIWSCPPKQMLSFPAASFIRFFANHGLLSATGQPQWYTVTGGSQSYVDKLTRSFAPHIRTNCGAVEIRRSGNHVTVRDSQGNVESFDHVVLASHADESLKLLADADAEERNALGAFSYQPNRAILHKDPQFMPKRKSCWASWVYHSDGKGDDAAITMTYWMNRLQNIDENYPLFVTLNPERDVPAEHVFDQHVFAHPVFDHSAVAAQPHVRAMQGRRNLWFCGAYMGYGFHEDGHVSALEAVNGLNAATGRPLHVILPLPARTQETATRERRRRPIAAEVALALRGSQ